MDPTVRRPREPRPRRAQAATSSQRRTPAIEAAASSGGQGGSEKRTSGGGSFLSASHAAHDRLMRSSSRQDHAPGRICSTTIPRSERRTRG